MADKSIPAAWIGDDIGVLVGDGLEPLGGPPLEVNDRGVVIDYLPKTETNLRRGSQVGKREAVRRDMKFVDTFIPWHRISGISRSRK